MSNTIIRKVIGNLKLIMKTYFYDKDEVDSLLEDKANVSDLNGKADASSVNSALAGKANASDMTTALNGKSDSTHTHDGRYPLVESVNSEISRLDGRINGLVGFRVEVVNGGLGSITNAEEGVMYILRNSETSGSNLYDEYIYINGQFEKIGDTAVEVDLSSYATTSFVNTSLSNYVPVNTYNTGMNGKVNVNDVAGTVSSSNNNPVSSKAVATALNGYALTGHNHNLATSSNDGLMSKEDKAKLDSLSSVMVSMSLSDNTSVDYESEE